MATVYLARDLKHDRRVALKVLHPELGAVLGIERFLSEIKTTANLQHPNILQLFDSGTTDGLVYYTMPYVEGESLRQRLERETLLPVPEALAIARGTAAALDYAHRHGVIHRDIKPENILLQDGQPLVADFGIALAVKEAGGARLTQTGLSLGTPQYMSPEQATGERELDPRSDVYSLGAVTYEMLAGEPPFGGATTQAVIARLMTDDPRPLSSIRRTVPPHIEAAVHRSLEKLPADRFATAAQFADALVGTGAETSSELRQSRAVLSRRQLRLPVAFMAAVTVLSFILAAWALSRPSSDRPRPPVRYTLTPAREAMILDVAVTTPIALTPDGSSLIYVGPPRGLYLWALDQASPTFLAGTEIGTAPFVSPDGEWIGFLVGGQVRKKSLRGGEVVTIGDIATGMGGLRGATWTVKDEIVVSTFTLGLVTIPAGGGAPRPMPVDTLSLMIRFPEALPDGDWIVASVASRQGPAPPELAAIGIADGRVIRLGITGSNPKYVEQGYLVYTSIQGGLHAVPFDAGRRRTTGTPRQISGTVSIGFLGRADLAVSRSGTIAYLEGTGSRERKLIRVDRSGKEQALDAPVRSYTGPRISPDGSKIAVTLGDTPNPPNDIWVYDLTLGTLARLTSDSASTNPEWSADGRRVYHHGPSFLAMRTATDRSAPAESLYTGVGQLVEVVPSRSGDTLITRELRSAEDDRDIFLVPLKPSGPPVKLAGGPGLQIEPALSPDGRWMAYTSEESGGREVYIRPFPGPGPRYQASSQGGQAPRWNPAGNELFFISRDTLVAVPIRTAANELVLGRSRPLFPLRYTTLPFHANYDVGPDGTWFVFVASTGDQATRSIQMVLNWFDTTERSR